MKVSGGTDEPDMAILAEDLRRAVGAFVRAVREGADTKTAQSEALGLLDRQGAMNVAALAQARGVTHQTMRLVVAQLEVGGLVQQTPDPADRRSHLFSITAAGRAETARARAARASRIEAMIRNALTREERTLLRVGVELLDRLSAAARD